MLVQLQNNTNKQHEANSEVELKPHTSFGLALKLDKGTTWSGLGWFQLLRDYLISESSR